MKSIAVLPAICCGPETKPLTLPERDELATRFKALADPTRVAIINSLSAADEVCVCNLTETFELSQPTISHHLKILRGGWARRVLATRHLGLLPARARGDCGTARSARRMNVLFVCRQNAGRSQMAHALYEQRGGNARSAGTIPAAHVHPEVAELMPELADRVPKQLDTADAEWADIVVTMGCGDACPVIPGKRYIDWELQDPAGQDVETVRKIRGEIERRVAELPL